MFLVLLTNCELWQHDNNGAWPGQKHESWPFYSLKGTWKSDDYCTRYKSHPNPSQANLFMKHVAGISQKLKHGRARLPPGSTDECMKAQEYSLFRLTTAGGSRSTAQIVGWKHDGTGNLPHWTDQSAAAHKYESMMAGIQPGWKAGFMKPFWNLKGTSNLRWLLYMEKELLPHAKRFKIWANIYIEYAFQKMRGMTSLV